MSREVGERQIANTTFQPDRSVFVILPVSPTSCVTVGTLFNFFKSHFLHHIELIIHVS